jgi:hypothetical protein
VTASLEERELWGGCHNRLPNPLDGSFYGVNSFLLGPAHVTNLFKKRGTASMWVCRILCSMPSTTVLPSDHNTKHQHVCSQ